MAAMQSGNLPTIPQADASAAPPPPSRSDANTMALTTYNPADQALSTTNPTTAITAPPVATTVRSHENVADHAVEAWTVVTQALMAAVIESHPPATAANRLLGIFRPMVEGWGAARREGKRWKERAEAHMAEQHKQKNELAQRHATLEARIQELEKKLEDNRAKVSEFEALKDQHQATIATLEKKVAEAQAEREAHAKAAEESKREVEALSKSAQDAKMKYEQLGQEFQDRSRSQYAEMNKLLAQVKEKESMQEKLEEQLRKTKSKSAVLEEEVAKKIQEANNLQTRVTELNNRKDALERQLALYQRLPTRRF